MEFAIHIFVFLLLSIPLSYLLFKTQVCLHYGRAIASNDFLKIRPQGFQEALTDPRDTNIQITFQILLIIHIGYLFFAYSWMIGASAIAGFYIVLSIMKRTLPPPESIKWALKLYGSITAREANLKRDGDELRYKAAKTVRERLETACFERKHETT